MFAVLIRLKKNMAKRVELYYSYWDTVVAYVLIVYDIYAMC